jgi:uracil-DNA glycosylase
MNPRKLIATARALRELGFDEVYITEEKHKEPVKEDKAELLRKLYQQMEEERKCILYEGASGYVFGEGDPNSPVVFVGEAPGEEEDKLKRPFVGRAGQYLNSKLEQVGTKEGKGLYYQCGQIKTAWKQGTHKGGNVLLHSLS